jgi:hypothetical protein
MIEVCFFIRLLAPIPKEAVMSGFSASLEEASAALKAAPPLAKTVTFTEPVITRSADADMMYAWSIGVTGAGRNHAEKREPPHREEESCPPEVYIG